MNGQTKASAPIDDLRADLAGTMAGRDGWKEWSGTWDRTEFSGPGEMHTRRRLYIQSLGGGRAHVSAIRENGYGQPCDIGEFTDVAQALAWVELPRSEDTYQHRIVMAELDAYERRNNVDVGGLKGVRAESGLNPKRQRFEVIDFDAPVGRVRITWLECGWRVFRNRRYVTVACPAAKDVAGTTLRTALERMADAGEIA